MKLIHLIAVAAIVAQSAVIPAYAQEEVDLQLQRREDQTVKAVPGEKLDHKGIIINPTPQQLIINSDGKTMPASRLDKLKVEVGAKAAAKAGVKQVEGAYRLDITPKGVKIVAFDKTGDFYARRTLDAIAASPASADGNIPCLNINDYPELPMRGVVEGYYGRPWSHEARMALIDFFGKNKMNCYIYGPKNDPYHTSPNWRKPYPAEDAAHLAELIKACDDNMVKFMWAVHPGSDIKWTEQDFADLMAKFEQLYQLGCRSFAIFFDDIRGEGTNPHKQVAFLNRLTEEFVKAKGDVTPLAMCPTDFTRAWADPSEDGPLAVYGRTLDPSVMVMWTGDAVCGDIGRETLQWVDSRTKRPALVWWNYPVTDYARHILNQGPVYGLDNQSTSSDLCGLMSNPMENAIASTVAFYGVADYTWNPDAYNPIDNWERAIVDRMPDCPEAYRDFAINSCDTEYGYRRAESWDTPRLTFENYTPETAKILLAQLERMKAAPAKIRANCSNAMLLEEIDPWLTQLSALAERTETALQMMQNYRTGNLQSFWEAYITNQMDTVAKNAYDAHKVGTLYWQPLYEDLMDKMVDGFYESLTGEKSSIPTVIGTFGNLQTPSRKKMFDTNPATVYFADRVQEPGDYIGVEFNAITPLNNVCILQGRDDKDVVVFSKAVLQYLDANNQWNTLTDTLKMQPQVIWTLPEGESAPMAKAVRLLKTDGKYDQGVGIREFAVNATGATNAFDKNPSTFSSITEATEIPLKEGNKTLILLMGKIESPLELTFADSKGTQVASQKIDDSFCSIEIPVNCTVATLNGKADLYEVIMK